MTFAQTAARLAGLAARVLGWRPGEFWAATPAEMAMSLGGEGPNEAPPSREEILTLIERDGDGRSA
ncbi:phage tail assembly chaperone [Qipengyuania sediminis]|uniref:phage tail assembly chaperone n=1 Tax=Qipengyuania sediminis TaxID=1532023 RepID=UPI001059FCE1|nr:phage tail assembly chaperone [Qipengyuania sediminis]